MTRPAKAIIDLAAVRHNYQLAQRLAPGAKAVAVVKANAYGHGAASVAKTLEPLAPALAVACTEEALELRRAGIRKPILLLEGPFDDKEVTCASEQDFWLMASCLEQVERIAIAKLKQPVSVWLKADSGMHRLGLVGTELKQAYQRLQNLDHINAGIVLATHFAAADELDSDFTQRQIETFAYQSEGLKAPISLANSAGTLGWPSSHGDWVRPGMMLYGASPFPAAHANTESLQAAMTLTSEVIGLRAIEAGESVGYGRAWTAQRRSIIAIVAMGYADGYPRHAPNGTPVLINGLRAKLAGRVSMDMITVDVTDLGRVQVGDSVELWGKHINVNEVANHAGTIGYELVTRMPARIPRHSIND